MSTSTIIEQPQIVQSTVACRPPFEGIQRLRDKVSDAPELSRVLDGASSTARRCEILKPQVLWIMCRSRLSAEELTLDTPLTVGVGIAVVAGLFCTSVSCALETLLKLSILRSDCAATRKRLP